MNLNELRSEIETIRIDVERVEALHRIIMDNYFCHREEDLKPNSPAMYGLMINYPDYSALIDVSFNYIHDINKQLQTVIDMLYSKEEINSHT